MKPETKEKLADMIACGHPIFMETDINTCVRCKFWLWFEDRQEYRCSIKGCWDGSKFREFDVSAYLAEVQACKKENQV